MRVGILTGGGDAPGLNGVVESATKCLVQAGVEVVGIVDGFEGVYNKDTIALTIDKVDGIHQNAGTILGTSNKRGIGEDADEFVACFKELKLDGLIAAGGDGTFKALSDVSSRINIIGIPKTIDNDLSGTDITFGHYTACGLISRSISTLKHSADAHKRIMVLETMGRTAGWLALNGGLAGYADAILIPELDFDFQALVDSCKEKLAQGSRGLVLCVSEGVKFEGKKIIKQIVEDAPETERLGGISSVLAIALEKELGIEARNVILGHLQRSEPPEVFDKLLTLQLGASAAELVIKNKWNKALAYKNCTVMPVELNSFTGAPRLVDPKLELIKQARNLGIFI
ncbi:MAG: ATP-dependent 6-phosphofructokinase [Bacteriovoracaceae bacterium]|nr:ATP-dependent 6-phosphofructokinase [Bacteriovoracaceae bacterium]